MQVEASSSATGFELLKPRSLPPPLPPPPFLVLVVVVPPHPLPW
ncbi:hypothetical protein [Mycobacterium sp.]